MIVRISSEGQYRLDSTYLDHINAIDNDIVAAIAGGDRGKFDALFKNLIELVRDHGEVVAAHELVESQLVLPPPDTTFEEATKLFVADGLVPD